MEHFLSFSDNTDNYADKIEINNYTQGENEKKVNTNVLKAKNILEIILSLKDYNYQILEKSEKMNYVTKKSLELSTFLDLNYDNYNYNKRKFNKTLVCNSLQNQNQLSSILFYNDYYGINIVICNKLNEITKYFKTGVKDLEKVFILYNDGNFTLLTETPEISVFDSIDEKMGPVDDPYYSLSKVIHFDIKPDNIIYNLSLKPIGSYKADEIINLAKENNLVLTKTNGKKKTKKELYDEINLTKL